MENVENEQTRKPYSFPIHRYISRQRLTKIRSFSEKIETPFLVMDLSVIKKKYQTLQTKLPFASVFYAVKANPMEEIILLLKQLGSNFDVASLNELDQLLKLGIEPHRISYGNTIKKERDIKYFYDFGVRLFATDSEEDLRCIARHAPGSRVFFRLISEGQGADWPLSRKFGSHPDMAYNLAIMARDLKLKPYGLSFHVGSQQRDIGAWDSAISQCTYLFNALKEDAGIQLKMINMGGGFPASYLHPTQKFDIYAKAVTQFLQTNFGDNLPEIIIEPGRSLVADAGVIITEVIRTSYKSRYSTFKWVYVDIGKFGGMIETIDESIKYPVYSDKEGLSEDVIIAGPTCDSMDILYEDFKYQLPDTLETGDRIYICTAGAYTRSYSAVSFNGFPPLKAFVLK
ncbi:MAG: ornithine decarboxylase [Spirochaetales bacterium]|nr:MAG: ornithine decarboxylase [Spirochaetales bacterium]